MDMDLLKAFIAGQVRHLVTVGAGILLTHGAIAATDKSQFIEIASGIGMWAIMSLWSWWQKSGQADVAGALKRVTGNTTTKSAVDTANAIAPASAVKALIVLLAVTVAFSLLIAPASAQPNPVPGAGCDPMTIFRGLTPLNFVSRMKGCLDDDLDNAILDAQSVPPDYGAQACLLPLKTLRGGLQKGGVLTGFQAYRRAKFMGLLSGCLNYVNSTVALP